MLSSRRVLTLLGASGAVAAVAMPVVALAHQSGGGGRGSAHSLSTPKQICRMVGVPLNGNSHSARHANDSASLTETQVQEMKTACAKLAAAYAVERSAEKAAFTANQQALEPELAQLNSACPRRHDHGHHGHGGTGSTGSTGATGDTGATGSTGATTSSDSGSSGSTGATGPTTACQVARTAFEAKVRATRPAYKQAKTEIRTAFETALTEFNATASATLGPDFAHGHHHHHHHERTPPGGSTGSTGATGSTGSTGSTGATGATGSTGSKGPALPPETGPGPHPGFTHHTR
jgi:hypothetical protein